MKELYIQVIIFLFASNLLLLSFFYFFLTSDTDAKTIIKKCLDSGGTVVEYQGKFEKCNR